MSLFDKNRIELMKSIIAAIDSAVAQSIDIKSDGVRVEVISLLSTLKNMICLGIDEMERGEEGNRDAEIRYKFMALTVLFENAFELGYATKEHELEKVLSSKSLKDLWKT